MEILNRNKADEAVTVFALYRGENRMKSVEDGINPPRVDEIASR